MKKGIFTLGFVILIASLFGLFKIPVIFGSAVLIWEFLALVGFILIIISLIKLPKKIKNK